jgi:hypothetical protein
VDRTSYAVIAVLTVAVVGGGAFLWSQRQQPVPAEAPAVATAPPPAPAPAASEPAVRYPIEAVAAAASAVPGGPSDLPGTLADLFGHKAVTSLFLVDDFPRRIVATVDNLGRAQAPSRLWPVHPAPGRFLVERRGAGEVISADNAGRYTPLVSLVETVDMQRLVAAYVRLYPQFQKAYEELGYPKRYFNDRLVEVIDVLLATPESDTLPAVHLPPIRGPVRPERPWVLYEFNDPGLQSLSAGQKMLIRMGPVNARRVKAQLAELRRQIAAVPAGR